MIALEHAIGIAEGGAVEGAHLDTCAAEWPPVPPRRRPAPHPIIQDPYLDPLASFFQEDIPERPPHRIVPEDVVLEVDVTLGPRDRLQPGVERDGSVELEAKRVALYFRGPVARSSASFVSRPEHLQWTEGDRRRGPAAGRP